MDTEYSRTLAAAQVYAAEVNLRVGFPLVRLHPNPNPTGGPLSFNELVAFAEKNPGWYDLQSVFLLIRKAAPAKGEVIRTGQQMAQYGWKREKRGQTTFWHLDNAARTGAN
jgi:hypothetical protein